MWKSQLPPVLLNNTSRSPAERLSLVLAAKATPQQRCAPAGERVPLISAGVARKRWQRHEGCRHGSTQREA